MRRLSNEFKIPFFPMENIFSQFNDKFMKFEEMEDLIHHVKFEMLLAFCKLLVSFSTVKLKLGHSFSEFIYRFKIGFLNLGLKLYFQVFPNSLNSWEMGIFEVPLLSYFFILWGLSFKQGICDGQGNQQSFCYNSVVV